MSKTRRQRAWIGSAVALAIAVQLLHGASPATAVPPSTTATAAGPTSTGPTAAAPATPDCNDVLAGGEQGALSKAHAGGGDQQLGFDVFRLQTDRPAGVYHVVDCIRTSPTAVTTVDLGDVEISGTATFRVNIPGSALPGDDVCDRFVLSGEVGGAPFTDISNQVCSLYSSCLFFGPGTCPPTGPSVTGGVASTTPRGGALPFTGSAALPLLLTAVALLGLGVASLVAARRRPDRPTG